MPAPHLAEQSESNQRSLWAIALIATFAIAAFWLTRPLTHPPGLTPVSGLITLQASARSAMSYDTAIAHGEPALIEFYTAWVHNVPRHGQHPGECSRATQSIRQFCHGEYRRPTTAQAVAHAQSRTQLATHETQDSRYLAPSF